MITFSQPMKKIYLPRPKVNKLKLAMLCQILGALFTYGVEAPKQFEIPFAGGGANGKHTP